MPFFTTCFDLSGLLLCPLHTQAEELNAKYDLVEQGKKLAGKDL
jgi:hypothetical protein